RALDPKNERCGVGIGFAGMLRGWSGVVVIAPNFGWREVDLRTMLRSEVGDACELYNDLNAIAYGEAIYGSARGYADVVCVYAGRLWEEVSTLLGLALANIVTTLNPSRLVMGGGVWHGAPELRRRSVARLLEFVNQPSREGFEVVDTLLGDTAGMLGAAGLI